MSAAEIIDELPKLSEAELRLVRQRLLELAAQNQDIDLCNQAALQGAMMLDRLEGDDAHPQSRLGLNRRFRDGGKGPTGFAANGDTC